MRHSAGLLIAIIVVLMGFSIAEGLVEGARREVLFPPTFRLTPQEVILPATWQFIFHFLNAVVPGVISFFTTLIVLRQSQVCHPRILFCCLSVTNFLPWLSFAPCGWSLSPLAM